MSKFFYKVKNLCKRGKSKQKGSHEPAVFIVGARVEVRGKLTRRRSGRKAGRSDGARDGPASATRDGRGGCGAPVR